MVQLWIAGRFHENYAEPKGERTRWGWGGVFGSREAAIAACEQENDFICPVVLDHNSFPDFEVLVGQEYPLNPRGTTPLVEGEQDEEK